VIGKTMRCSSAMVQPVCHLDAPEFVPINTGCPGNRTERCLSYDEKPLLLFQKLKDASKNPVFMLKHIKDIRSPIAVPNKNKLRARPLVTLHLLNLTHCFPCTDTLAPASATSASECLYQRHSTSDDWRVCPTWLARSHVTCG